MTKAHYQKFFGSLDPSVAILYTTQPRQDKCGPYFLLSPQSPNKGLCPAHLQASPLTCALPDLLHILPLTVAERKFSPDNQSGPCHLPISVSSEKASLPFPQHRFLVSLLALELQAPSDLPSPPCCVKSIFFTMLFLPPRMPFVLSTR